MAISKRAMFYIGVGVVLVIVVVAVVLTIPKSAGPAASPPPTFSGWKTGGNSYLLDLSKQQGWTGLVSADTTPITCPSVTVTGPCTTDLTSAGAVCDADPTCIGLIYDMSNSSGTQVPLATPVNTTPTKGTVKSFTNGPVFLSPLAPGATPPSLTMTLSTVPNTQGINSSFGVNYVNGSVDTCYTKNQATAGSCQGVLVPNGGSAWQQQQQATHASTIGLTSESYAGLVAGAAAPDYTTALNFTYNP